MIAHINDVIHYTQEKKPAQATRCAIEAIVAHAQMKELLALRGRVDIADNWQALRSMDTAARYKGAALWRGGRSIVAVH